MRKSITRRVLQMIPILFILTFLVFALMYLSGSDPAMKKLTAQGTAITQELLDRTRESMGLDRPFLTQYGSWLLGVLHGDFGRSYINGKAVLPELLNGLGYTCILAAGAMLLSILISIPLGILTAVYKDSVFDHVVRLLTFVGNAQPNFLLAVVLMYLFCIYFKIFPVLAKPSLQGLVLPAAALAIPLTASFIRQIRGEVLTQLNAPYIATMRMRGLKERYILKNALYNSMGSILTIFALSVGTLMGGSVVIETMFRWNGIGSLVMEAISKRDYPVVQGFVLLMALIYMLINLLTDLAYNLLDPRVKFE